MINTYEEIKNFREAVDNFVNIINRQNDIISNLEMKLNEKDGINWYHHGFKVTKKNLWYISQGIEERKAISLTYDDFTPTLSMRSIEMIWDTSRASKSGLVLYGRAYCAKKMRLAGFKIYEIAQTLNVSATTVNKLLKQCCITEKESA